MRLQIDSSTDDWVQVHVSKHLTLAGSSSDWEPLCELIGPDTYSKVVRLDLSSVEAIDSNGIGWLMRCDKEFRSHGGKLVLHSVTPHVTDVMKLMALESVFNIVDDVPLMTFWHPGRRRWVGDG